jgi:hypothetical protein
MVNGSPRVSKLCFNFLNSHFEKLKLSTGIKNSFTARALQCLEDTAVNIESFGLLCRVLNTLGCYHQPECQNIIGSAIKKRIDYMHEFIAIDESLPANLISLANALVPLCKLSYSSGDFLILISKKVLENPRFALINRAGQFRILKLCSDMIYYNRSEQALEFLGSSMEIFFHSIELDAETDLLKLEPVLHCIYKSNIRVLGLIQKPTETSPESLTRFRKVFAMAQTSKIALMNENAAKEKMLAVSNVYAFARELQKPASSRSSQDAHLSWKSGISMYETLT